MPELDLGRIVPSINGHEADENCNVQLTHMDVGSVYQPETEDDKFTDGKLSPWVNYKEELNQLKDTKADVIIAESAKAASHTIHAQSGKLYVTLYGQTTETGSGEKSPDNPYAISGVNKANVRLDSKNLSNAKDITLNANNLYFDTFQIGVDAEAGVTYTFSADVVSSVTPFTVSIGIGDETAYKRDIASTGNFSSGRVSVTFTVSKELVEQYGAKLQARVPRYSTPTTYNATISNIQLEVGNVQTDYEPFGGSVIDMPLLPDGAPLYGNGTVMDTIENDVLVGGERKCKVVRYWESFDLSNYTFGVYNGQTVLKNDCCYFNVYSNDFANVKSVNNIVCTHFTPYANVSSALGVDVIGTYAQGKYFYIGIKADHLEGYAAFDANNSTTWANAFNAWLAEKHVLVFNVKDMPDVYYTTPYVLSVDDGVESLAVMGSGDTSVKYAEKVKHYVDNRIIQRNLFNRRSISKGYLPASGTSLTKPSAVNNEITSDYIGVTPGETYALQVWCTPTVTEQNMYWAACCFFDSDMNLVGTRQSYDRSSMYTGDDAPISVAVNAPAGVSYIRVSARTYNDGRVKFNPGKAEPWNDNDETEWVSDAKSIDAAGRVPNSFAAMIPPLDGTPVTFDFDKKTVTFPNDTVFKPWRVTKTGQPYCATKDVTVSWSHISSSAIQIVFDHADETIKAVLYDYSAQGYQDVTLLAFIRTSSRDVSMNGKYKIAGVSDDAVIALETNQLVNSIAHRGYSTVAPENTLAAFKLAKTNGFEYAECDVSFTSDGVAVLLHDETIDRTSNGTGNIGNMTYAQVSQYDFGSWKSSAYAGEKIPTFEEFVKLCKRVGLKMYIELKAEQSPTSEQILGLVNTVKRYGMLKNATWISFSSALLTMVNGHAPTARLGFVVTSITSSAIEWATGAKTDANEVFLDVESSTISTQGIESCVNAGVPVEVWTINDATKIAALDPYVSGFTSDNLVAGAVLHDAFI